MKTEGLPEEFNGIETFEFTVAPKQQGTEVVAGIDTDKKLLLFFCRGKHKKRYGLKVNGEEVEGSPFEGTVPINLETFGDIYLTVMGLKEDTGYLGIDASHRMRVKTLQDGRVQFSFTNYKDVQRTLFHLHGWKLVLAQAVFEMLKRKVPVIEFHHSEADDLTISTTYDRENSTLTISHEYGKIDLVDKSVFAVKQMLENYLFYGRETTREFRVGPAGMFTLKTDGTLYVAGRNVSKKTISIPLCGTMKEVRAYPMMLWKSVS